MVYLVTDLIIYLFFVATSAIIANTNFSAVAIFCNMMLGDAAATAGADALRDEYVLFILI